LAKHADEDGKAQRDLASEFVSGWVKAGEERVRRDGRQI